GGILGAVAPDRAVAGIGRRGGRSTGAGQAVQVGADNQDFAVEWGGSVHRSTLESVQDLELLLPEVVIEERAKALAAGPSPLAGQPVEVSVSEGRRPVRIKAGLVVEGKEHLEVLAVRVHLEERALVVRAPKGGHAVNLGVGDDHRAVGAGAVL